MKKNLLLALMVLSTFTSLANARFFLGIDGGYSMDKVDVKTETTRVDGVTTPGTLTKDAYKGNGYLFNINLGTEHHFDKNNYVGFRWFLAGGYGRTTLINQEINLIKYPSSIIEAKLGLDLLLDVVKFGNNSLGIFGGVEGGANITLSDTYYLDDRKGRIPNLVSGTLFISPRVGLSLFLADHHRIEFVTKIPVYTWADYGLTGEGKISTANFYKPLQFMLGYKFVF